MKRNLISIVIVMIATLDLFSQAKWESPVQFFTPNAESFGKFGEIPVNYFNGLPGISIPITTFKVNNYELPVSLSYHAGGNKPDSHPGWVGNGWNLSAGGSINRIVKGIKDETSGVETVYFAGGGNSNINTGFLYRFDSINTSYWKDSTYLSFIATKRLMQPYGFTIYPYDTEPDEFQVNIDDISATFYIVGNNQIKIKSKNNTSFKIQYSLATNYEISLYENYHSDIYANCFTYINEIILTNNKGVKYFFGGDLDAIEFSYQCNSDKFTGIANTWHLKKIELPNSEIITLNYKKDGIPIMEHNNHSFRAHYIYNTPIYTILNTRTSTYANFSYFFCMPSYLTSITSNIAGKTMLFSSSESVELVNSINESAFTNKVLNINELLKKWVGLNGMTDKNYYLKLDMISYSGLRYIFDYTNSTTTRLKLMEISKMDDSNEKKEKFIFEYNTESLPNYNSKKTDNWGFYNNKYYDNIDYENLYEYRSADSSYAKAEILQKITYPTGGSSLFVYELNDYSKIANQFPFTITNSTGYAGGLRIKKIINSDLNNTTIKEFEYKNQSGESSGILSGKQIYNVSGNQHVKFKYSGWFGVVFYTENTDFTYSYILRNQNFINQIGNTSGNHITYSRIIEKLSDGSKTIFSYSNHETYPDLEPENILDNIDDKLPINPLISREIERGLLDSVEYYSNNENLIKKDVYKYNSNPDRYENYVKSINIFELNGMSNMVRVSAIRTYTFCPYLESKKEILYNNGICIQSEHKFKYDKFSNQMIIDKYYNSFNDSITTVFLYPFHIAWMYSPFDENPVPYVVNSMNSTYNMYRAMSYSNFNNLPVEIIKFKNNSVFHSKLYTYKQNLSNFVVDSVFELSNTVNIPNFELYHPLTGKDTHYNKYPEILMQYDIKSNIIETTQVDGFKTIYLWSYKNQYPIAEIKNATITEVENAIIANFSVISINALSELSTPNETFLKDGTLQRALPNAQVTTFTYWPHTGMKSMTDPRQITTTYEYDSFNRLQFIKNKDGVIIQSFDYKYKQQ